MRPPLPPTLGARANPQALWSFLTSIFKPDIPYRIAIRRLLNRIRLYRLGIQWLDPLDDDGSSLGADWQILQQDDQNGIPMPTQNEIFPLVTREAALLTKVGERPYIRPNREDVAAERAASVGKHILLSLLEEIGWHDTEREGATHCATYGTWWNVAYMDFDHTKTLKVPTEGALACPNEGCDTKFASPELTDLQAQKIGALSPSALSTFSMAAEPDEETAIGGAPQAPSDDLRNQQEEPTEESYQIARCPTCQTHTEMGMRPAIESWGGPALDDMGNQRQEFGPVERPGGPRLVPYTPTEEEVQSGEDFAGTPFGDDVPRGDATVRNISPFDGMPNPSSQGIDCTPANWEEFSWQRPETLEWIRAHYPENGFKVKAENNYEIWRFHPLLGGLGMAGVAIGGPDLFQNCALVKMFVKKPYLALERDDTGQDTEDGTQVGRLRPKRNHGRLIVAANHVILEDGDYEVESQLNPGTYIERYHFDWAPWELRDREAHGLGMVELLLSQQDTINTNKSQQMDARHRFANPKWLAENGIQFDYTGGANSSYTSDFLYWTRASKEQEPPKQFEGMTIPAGVFTEFENDISACPRIVLAAEVEGGDPPGGVEAYSALLLLAQKAADSRRPRTERIRDMKKRIFRHLLVLVQEFYREPRLFRMRGPNDKWSIKSFKGADLDGQVDVQFDVEPVIDVGVARREGIQLGLKLGTIDTSTASAKWRLNRELEIPNDINEDQNQQVKQAENEGLAWFTTNEWPIIDESGDADDIHWQVHKEDLGSEKWRELKDACGWKKVLIALWGWEKDFISLLDMEEQMEAMPPQFPDRALAKIDPRGYIAQVKMYQGAMQVQQQLQEMPKPTELRILQVWMQTLMESGVLAGIQAMGQDAVFAFKKVVRYSAHAEAHRIRMERAAMAANAGAAQAAAPGAAQNAQGMIPGAGQAAIGPAGGGAGAGALPSPNAAM